MENEHPAMGVCALPDYIHAHPKEFGMKLRRLVELTQLGYNVPPFVGVSAGTVFSIAEEPSSLLSMAIARDAHRTIGATSYAVRSAAFLEDDARASHAGEFMTLLDVLPDALPQALMSVIAQARGKGQVTLAAPFSVIIQEYVAPDAAGVIFTRNPLGGREAVIEWRKGVGKAVVEGEAVARTEAIGPHHLLPEPFPDAQALFVAARAIEVHYGEPQDIEWAVKGGRLFLLQTRPVTTISAEEFRVYRSIDTLFAGAMNYYFARTTLAESFIAPPPLARELLAVIYAPGGAVARAYASLGIHYGSEDCFTLIGGELFVDQEKELKQFFPTHSYFRGKRLAPHLSGMQGFLRTLKNIWHLGTLRDDYVEHRKRIKDDMEKMEAYHQSGVHELTHAITQYGAQYHDVFLINICAGKVLERTKQLFRDIPVSIPELLRLKVSESHGVRTQLLTPTLRAHMLGNSLNICDQTPFIATATTPAATPAALAWWEKFPKAKQDRYRPHILLLQEYEALREEGRWLTVLLVSAIREVLIARYTRGIPQELLFYASLKELHNASVNEEVLRARAEVQKKEEIPAMPTVIASTPLPSSGGSDGISPGIATGVIALPGDTLHPEHILLVPRLSPELTQYLDIPVAGIISGEGGMLSHFAIIAREYGIPVVVDRKAYRTLKRGDRVTIDGEKGIVGGS